MKRILSLILTVIMVLALTACGGKTAETTASNITDAYKGEFRVGFGKVNITPEYSLALQGYGNIEKRMSQGFLDYIYTICIAISDNDNNTVLLFNNDNCNFAVEYANRFRTAVSQATGVPFDNIYMNCTHTHSAPALGANTKLVPMTLQYIDDLCKWTSEAAVEALNDRAPAEIYVGSSEAVGLNFVRHYFDVNGLCYGNNHNSTIHADPVKHTTDADPTAYVVRFIRQGDKKDILYTNWRAHPTRTGGITIYDISSDYVGPLRDKIESDLDVLCAYYEGAAGNINPVSEIASEKTYPSDYVEYGQAIAQYIINIADSLTKVESGTVKASNKTLSCKVNHTQDNLAGMAAEVSAIFAATNDPHTAQAAGAKYGIYSAYHASAIRSRAKMGTTSDVNIYTLTIGDSLAFTYVPFEQFDTNGVYIEENSPYKYTIVQGYTNGSLGYIPSAYGYEYGCYEADTGKFQSGTGEEIAEALVNMLKSSKS